MRNRLSILSRVEVLSYYSNDDKLSSISFTSSMSNIILPNLQMKQCFTKTMEKYNLAWKQFESAASNTLKDLYNDIAFSDVTLVCEDNKQLKTHKVIISSCSPFFKNILKNNPHQHPLIYLKGIKFEQLQSVLKFVYLGQTEVE